ncbi:hypothetical protein [Candidatus Vidania fulgoroideorum]
MIKKVIFVRKTTFVREGGRHFRYTVYSVVSNLKNKIGIGCSRSKDISNSISKSFKYAKKNYFKFKIGNKLKKNICFKVNKTYLKVFPASDFDGLIIGGNARKIILLTGIKNIKCKIYGSKNKINVIKATKKLFNYLNDKRNIF